MLVAALLTLTLQYQYGLHATYHAIYVNNVPEARTLYVAACESRFNPLATNPRSGARGVFQFLRSTWNAYAPRYLPPDRTHYDNAYDAYANAYLATSIMRDYGYSDWILCLPRTR